MTNIEDIIRKINTVVCKIDNGEDWIVDKRDYDDIIKELLK